MTGLSAYSRLGKAKSMMQRSRSRNKTDESSGDELAETAVLYNVPSLSSNQPIRLPSLHGLGALAMEDIIRPQTSKSESMMLDKPLPPMPPKDPFAPFAEQKRLWKNKPVLRAKTTNMKAPASPSKPSTKPIISSPIPLSEVNKAAFPTASRPTTSQTTQTVFSTQTTTTNKAEELSTKISNLMQQAAAQEEQTRQKSATYKAESAKLSPLERSRNAIVKATRAIKGKLSSSSSSSSTSDRPSKPKRRMSTQPSPSSGSEPPPQYESQDELQGRLERRISEGRNLANPKVQALTDNGHIPRKPLPVYESMKSRSLRSGSAEEPLSDEIEPDRCLSPQDYSGFDFDFSKRKYISKATSNLPTSDQSDGPAGLPHQQIAISQSSSHFSSMISGLAQHPDTMVFSSPPIAASTPQTQLQPRSPTNTNKTSSEMLFHRQPILDPGFETRGAEPSDEEQLHRPTASDGSSLSVKRKGATHDLRISLGSTKKPKTASITSLGSVGLAVGISQLDTGDERAPLSSKSTNVRVGKADINESKMRRGLSIFDVVKGTDLEAKDDKAVKKPNARPDVTKRSSFPRPSSALFSRGRDSRFGMQRLHSYGGDDMDVDELQSGDVTYQVGGRKK